MSQYEKLEYSSETVASVISDTAIAAIVERGLRLDTCERS